jgi:hypothetical protein
MPVFFDPLNVQGEKPFSQLFEQEVDEFRKHTQGMDESKVSIVNQEMNTAGKKSHVVLVVQRHASGLYYPLAVVGMTLLIFSDMPTFAVELILKQLSWHAAVKRVLGL